MTEEEGTGVTEAEGSGMTELDEVLGMTGIEDPGTSGERDDACPMRGTAVMKITARKNIFACSINLGTNNVIFVG